MPFEYPYRKSVAVIGAGVSGLAAAYLLSRDQHVTLYEASPRLGGHARTIMAGSRRDVAVDTGFIVFNYHTYPHLTSMFDELDVPVRPSDMSFGVSIGNGAIEYSMRDIASMAAQPRNLLRPRYWRMVSDILRFNKEALGYASSSDITLDEMLSEMQFGDWFRKYYLLPLSGAIWSSTPDQIGRFPARALLQFFENHALLTPNTHQWYTVDGGSVEYVRRIAAAIRSSGGLIRTATPVRSVRRGPTGVSITTQGGIEQYDEVVFACHSDQALALLSDPTVQERSILGRVRYQDNRAVLHRDSAQMPRRRRAWSSWVYRNDGYTPDSRIGITYWMNSLQGISEDEPLFVSLNPKDNIRDELIYDETVFAHPVFDRAALEAQNRLRSIQGANHSWFCGAWTRHGFHEDGYASAVAVAERIPAGRLAA